MFIYDDMNEEILNNLKNNLNFFPVNLNLFSISMNSDNISENSYYDFIEKILHKCIKNLYITLKNREKKQLTKKEIEKIFHNADLSRFEDLSIDKY